VFVRGLLQSGYVHQARGLYAQMIVGDSFPPGVPWNNLTTGGCNASFTADDSTLFNKFPSMRVTVTQTTDVRARVGVAEAATAAVSNRGLGNEGLFLQGGKPYEGYVYVLQQSAQVEEVTIALRDYTANPVAVLASISVPVVSSLEWQRVRTLVSDSAASTAFYELWSSLSC
jgi:hypothetical protein